MDENGVVLFPYTINSYPRLGHIVQLITDNASAYKKAGKKITAKVWYFIVISLCSSLH